MVLIYSFSIITSLNLLNSLKPTSYSITTIMFHSVTLISLLLFFIIKEVITIFFLAKNIMDIALIGRNYAKLLSTITIGVYPKYTSLAL